ncbi:hypothetical protein UFOVP670_33 [uncultured Caudovirales phage]|uniref:Uncharacterized protein n=1 Tax=uncultured Caudovirales phage TaxID=2100421 RepID=A0A6J5NCW7_9CAUD|nr:hypothetical protein UFOVP670_33 [uncultured Caudovirales phage]
MSDIVIIAREALKIGIGVALMFAMPIAALWGVVILMTWLQKAVLS